jgi:hypothetical protein
MELPHLKELKAYFIKVEIVKETFTIPYAVLYNAVTYKVPLIVIAPATNEAMLIDVGLCLDLFKYGTKGRKNFTMMFLSNMELNEAFSSQGKYVLFNRIHYSFYNTLHTWFDTEEFQVKLPNYLTQYRHTPPMANIFDPLDANLLGMRLLIVSSDCHVDKIIEAIRKCRGGRVSSGEEETKRMGKLLNLQGVVLLPTTLSESLTPANDPDIWKSYIQLILTGIDNSYKTKNNRLFIITIGARAHKAVSEFPTLCHTIFPVKNYEYFAMAGNTILETINEILHSEKQELFNWLN